MSVSEPTPVGPGWFPESDGAPEEPQEQAVGQQCAQRGSVLRNLLFGFQGVPPEQADLAALAEAILEDGQISLDDARRFGAALAGVRDLPALAKAAVAVLDLRLLGRFDSEQAREALDSAYYDVLLSSRDLGRPWPGDQQLDDAVAVLLGANPSEALPRPPEELLENAVATVVRPSALPGLLRACEKLKANGKLPQGILQPLRDRIAFLLTPPDPSFHARPPVGPDITVGGTLTLVGEDYFLSARARVGREFWVRLDGLSPETRRTLDETRLGARIEVSGDFEAPGQGLRADVKDVRVVTDNG